MNALPDPFCANPIVRSLLETDLYKFTMQQVLLHKHPDSHAEFEFRCRNTPAFPLVELEQDINRELDHLCTLRFTNQELAWLSSLRFLKPDYIEFLSLFQFRRKFIRVWRDGDQLRINAVGPQIHVMGFEIPVLYIVSELYMRRLDPEGAALEEGARRLNQKVAQLREFGGRPAKAHPYVFFDFGLRRRHSRAMHELVTATLSQQVPEYFKGTSNCYLAMTQGLTAIGTMAHEYLQSFQQFGVRLRDFQKAALETWVQEYRGDLGVALTDVVGIDAFLADFDRYHGLLWDGVRHDSGDPVLWGEKMLARYAQLHIDASTKRFVFSDGLDLSTSFDLYQRFGDAAGFAAGIGTFLTNDTGLEPLNLVMKVVEVNGGPVAKLSDSPGKSMCRDEGFVSYLRQVFDHP